MHRQVVITNYIYESSKIPLDFDGFKIVAISDLHCNELGTDNCQLLSKIHEIRPNAVMMMGDMITDNGIKIETVQKFIDKLVLHYPVFYACGNHELKFGINPVTTERYNNYINSLISMGVHFLDNKSVYINRGESSIKVTGLNIDSIYYSKFWNKTKMPDTYIESLIGKAEPDIVDILLAHHPDYFSKYSIWGADIVFSGHVHGGIMVLPVIGGVISPSYKLFPKYDFGCFTMEKSHMYLSRGLGSHTIPIRIFNKPEIISLSFHKP